MMKERFSKLLLGEDMSGSGKGVCTALAISNAITNLCGMKKTKSFLSFYFSSLITSLLSWDFHFPATCFSHCVWATMETGTPAC